MDSALPSSFIDDYHSLLTLPSKYKQEANAFVKEIDEEKAVNSIMDSNAHPGASPSFMACVKNQVFKGVDKLKLYGCIPSTYKEMGLSPRISPVRYGASINSTKKIVRNYGYQRAATVYKRYGYSLVDVDLRATYTGVLLGLYPSELYRLRTILKKETLWDSIRSDYERAGIIYDFDKPSVKACVYAALFGGGKRAMFESILDNKRKLAGLTETEFKDDEMYESVYKLATVITHFMLSHPIVEDFYYLSKTLKKDYDSQWFTGPSGHAYKITDHSFQSVFPYYLQSYEFSLLAVPTLELVPQHPQLDVLGHFHDGNVLAIPTENLETVINDLKEKVLNVGRELRLGFPIDIDVQQVFKPFSP